MTATPDDWPQCKSQNRAVSRWETCLVKGKISVNKVEGGFHIAPGRNMIGENNQHSHDLMMHFPHLDLSHRIQRLRFGSKIPDGNSPLEGERLRQPGHGATFVQYSMMVTPLSYEKNGNELKKGYEYSVTTISRSLRVIGAYGPAPGIFFRYAFTPYGVTIHATSRSFAQYLVSTGGFLAGSFALAMIFDTILHETDLMTRFKKKETTTEN
jgi:hypothetical protein